MTVLDRRRVMVGGAAGALAAAACGRGDPMQNAETVLVNARITTLDRSNPAADAALIRGGKFAYVGEEAEARRRASPRARFIDGGGRRAVPGLIDSHTHLIRGGLNYNMELRWDGVRSLADAMGMLKAQAQATPPPQWVRVVGGFTEHQFTEKRLPTLEEINAAAPETPVFILHLYDRALLNRAALRAVGYTRETPDPPGAFIERDARGEPTGLLVADPNATILYSTLAKGPKLPPEMQLNSTRHFMRELNRLGVTSVIDAGGGFQNFPDDYAIIEKLHRDGDLTVRIAYNLFTQKPRAELADFAGWAKRVSPGQGDDFYRHNGAGEMLVYSAADFEDFRVARPDMPASMEGDLEPVVRLLAENRWPWRMHATYDETITRALDVFEKVHRDTPIDGLNWFIDHAETISPRSIDRIAALGGGVAVQHRMAFQGEYFVERYGAGAAAAAPPVAAMLAAGLPVGAGTDATRVASYNPWVSLSWLTTGRTVGGLRLYPSANRLDREAALRLWTERNAWFSNEAGKKGRIATGELADLILLDRDYFSIPEDEISGVESALTLVGGDVVWGADEFSSLAPPLPPAAPDWSPVRRFGGYGARSAGPSPAQLVRANACCPPTRTSATAPPWSGLGCACWAF